MHISGPYGKRVTWVLCGRDFYHVDVVGKSGCGPCHGYWVRCCCLVDIRWTVWNFWGFCICWRSEISKWNTTRSFLKYIAQFLNNYRNRDRIRKISSGCKALNWYPKKGRYCLCPSNGLSLEWLGWPRKVAVSSSVEEAKIVSTIRTLTLNTLTLKKGRFVCKNKN